MHGNQRASGAGLTPAQRAAFHVAERLGMTVGELLDRATAAEIITWARLEKLDDDIRAAESLRKLVERGQANGGSRRSIRTAAGAH